MDYTCNPRACSYVGCALGITQRMSRRARRYSLGARSSTGPVSPPPAPAPEIGTSMHAPRSRLLRTGTAIVALLVSGALLTAGATPAQASAPPATTDRTIEIETHRTGASSDVHSVSIEAPGGLYECLAFDTSPLGHAFAHRTDPNWIALFYALPWKATYTVYSYSDYDCTPENYFIGSRGTISPSVSNKWAVYSGHVPKRAF